MHALKLPSYLSIIVVSVPRGSKRFLAAKIPHDEVYVVPDHLLHVAADGGGGVDDLVHQELVKDCRLARVVEPDQTNFVF